MSINKKGLLQGVDIRILNIQYSGTVSKSSADPEVVWEYKRLRNAIQQINENEKKEYYSGKFNDAHEENDSKKNVRLQSKKDLSSTQLHIDGELCSNPKRIADEFNKIFINKIKKLRQDSNIEVTIDPATRLSRWLTKRTEPIPEFN